MKSILIISPKEDDAKLIRESLPSDYQVKNADSVINALELHRQCSFDVIFSDLKLMRDTPETNNIAEAIKPFKEMNPQAEVLMTNFESECRVLISNCFAIESTTITACCKFVITNARL